MSAQTIVQKFAAIHQWLAALERPGADAAYINGKIEELYQKLKPELTVWGGPERVHCYLEQTDSVYANRIRGPNDLFWKNTRIDWSKLQD